MNDDEKFRILVVDDNKSSTEALLSILKPEYAMIVAKDGPTALKYANNKAPDLILLDVVMPGMSGFETLTELKKAELTREIPVIFITGMDDPEDEQKGLALGAVDYIRKPYNGSVVKARVRTHQQIARQIRDIEQLRIKAESATKAKSEFLASMSHEIRTPMNAIIGISELLLKGSFGSEQYTSYVNDIKTASTALLAIINDILDFSKIEAGKLELTPVNYDFQALIHNIESMFKFVVEEKGLAFKLDQEGEIPKCLYGDDVRLRQILTNICGNAVKFTSSGYIRLKVKAADEMLTIEIKDSGMGIPKEDLPKLFSAFSQADTQKNRNIKGTGLGLAISKSFAELMGGNITVDSVYGQGTTFTVTIPKIIGNESMIMSEEKAKKKRSFIAPEARILVVDDTELNLKVAAGLLNLFKINAVTVSSGKEAISAIQKADYDIVFMDHMMPEMDGIETTKEVRKLGGKYKQLPIIALTANAIQGAKEMFMANDFNGFISKPIEINELVGMLLEWLPAVKIEFQEETLSSNTIDDNSEEQKRESFLDSIKNISGINTEIGLSRVSGSEDIYYETLTLFCKKLLSECAKMEEFLQNEDLRNFAISVHGMKSSLSTIGVMELSDTAFRLEVASKNEDLGYCAEHLPGFLDNLRSLHERLSPVFIKEKAALPRQKGTIECLRENTRAALSAVEEFDMDLASEALGKLLAYDFGEQTNALLDNAYSAVHEFDFNAADDYLNRITDAAIV